MKKLPLTLLSALAIASAVHAQTTVSSDPVGFVSVIVNANSDGTLGLPLHRPSVLQTTVSAVTNNVVTVNTVMTANQFVYSSPSQTDHFYLNVRAAANSSIVGNWYEVSANSTSAITVTPNSSSSVQAQGLTTGDTVEIIPFWSLTKLFPNGQGIVATTDFNALQGQIFLMPSQKNPSPGTDFSASQVYIYWTGGQGLATGWYNTGDGSVSDDQYFLPDNYLVIRNKGASRQITVTGSVPMSSFASALGTVNANQSQDNLTTNPFPVTLNLTQLNLFQSGAFAATTDFNSFQDQLLLFDPSSTGFDVAPSKVLIYWTGGQGLSNGWYNTGTGAGPLDTTELVSPGVGFIVRKKGSANPSSARWAVGRPY